MHSAAPIIGIDFGTSNSKVAWYNPRTNQAEIIRNAEGEEQTPSIVYFGKQQILAGSPAREMLEYEHERDRIIISIKRELMSTPLIALPDRSMRPVEVAAEILRKLKRDTEELHFLQEVTRAVITYPASFGPLERDKIRAAAHLAGFTEVELLEEPVAAAIAYAQMGLKVGNHVLVYDLGGGTFDLAILAREEDGSFRVALEPQGIKRCGGDDFDEALYSYSDQLAREKLGRPISLTGKRDLYFLQQCRQRKENLSNVERRVFKSLLEPGSVIFQYEIERATFEGLISEKVGETIRKTRSLVEAATADGYTLDTVVLVGGSTSIPLTQRLLNEQLPVKPLRWQYRDMAVALGAAYHAYNLNRQTVPGKPRIVSRSGKFVYTKALTGHSGSIYAVAISPDGHMLASGSFDKTVRIWNLHTGELLQILTENSHYINSLAFSPDAQMLASGSADATIKLWNLRTQFLLRTFAGHSNWVRPIAISPDGQTLVSGSDDKTIKVWNLQTGRFLRSLAGHSGSVCSIAISPDGQVLVSGSDDKTIKVWNLQTGRLLRTLAGHSLAINSIAISPDGQKLVSGSNDKTIKVWNLQTGELHRTFTGHFGPVRSLAISPDGRSLASGSNDKTVKIWNLQAGTLLDTFVGHSDGFHAMALSPDGKTLAVGCYDQTIKIWRKTETV